MPLVLIAAAALILIGFTQLVHRSKSATSSTSSAAPLKWTFQGQANAADESAWAAEHRKLGDMVRRVTDGQVDIAYVSDAAADREVLSAVQARMLNLGFMGVHYMEDAALLNFQLLPIVPNHRLPEILAVLKPRFSQIWEERWNVKLLAFSYYLPQLLYTARPADTLQALKGQRIRQFGRDAIKLYAGGGSSPVAVQHVSQVLPNLMQGNLDGAQGALPAYVNFGWAQRLKYISNWPVGSTYMALVLNMDDWRALTPALQVRLIEAAEQLEKNQWNGRQTHVESLLRQAQLEHGAMIMNPSPAEVARLLAQAGPVLEDWKKQAGPDSELVLAAINNVLGTGYK